MATASWLGRDASVAAAFERRAARAAALAEASINGDALRFAAGLCRAQGKLAAALIGCSGALTGALERDLERFAPELAELADTAGELGPPGLRAEVERYRAGGAGRLVGWWRGARSGRADYLARALLRPYAEALVALGARPEPRGDAGEHGCSWCGGAPWIAWRRAGAGDEAAARFVGCGVCGTVRAVVRISCAGCGETAPDRLAVFHSERHPAARLEACESCKRYVKSIDLTLDGRAIPEVDDLCSLSLDLWAVEHGFERLEPSLAGM